MGICGRLLSLYRREEPVVDKRGKAILANGELYIIKFSPHLRVRDVCIEIAKKLNIAPVALDFFTLMTTDCEHCLRPNRQVQQQCDKQNDHYLNPKRILHADEIASKVFFFRLAFKAVAGPDLKAVNSGAYEYFVMQCRWDYINGRINNLSRKDHLTLLVLESIMQAHEAQVSCKDVLDHPKRFGLLHLFDDKDYSCREIKSHLKKQLSQFKTAQSNFEKAKNSFLYVLEGVTDFGVTKIVVKKFYYQSASEDVVYPVEWEIMISPNGLKKRRTYKDERDDDNDDTTGNRVDEMISDYKDIEYLEIKQSESDEIIHISRQKGFLEVISVGKSMIKKESLITLIEGFYHLFVNQYKTLTKYEPGLELPLSSARQNRKVPIHGPIERKKVEALLKAVETDNGDRSGVHMIRRSRKDFDSYNLSLIHGSEIKHYEIVYEDDKYSIKNGPKFDNMAQLLEFYKTEQRNFPTVLTKYCPIPKGGLCALYDDQIVVEAPCVPSTSRPEKCEYPFEYIGNQQLEKLHHTFTCNESGDRIFKARWLKGDKGGCQEAFCRRIETSRAPNYRDKVIKICENMADLTHHNLVLFHGVQFNDDQNTYLAFEWLNSGTLDEYLKTETEITLETILSFACQIAEACYYLHDKNYIHGWLAAHNILIVNEEEVKLSDVSVPCLREEDMLCETVNINRSPWKARECFQGRRYSKESDVWAFGIVLWEMFMKTVPFQNMEDDKILRIFQQDHHLAYPKWCPDEVGKIMKSCWITEPTQRPTFAEIVVKLRHIRDNLSKKERARKIPETTDEKFTIEPLNIRKDKPSLAPVDENLPRTSSCGSHDNSDGAADDVESNEGSDIADDFELDLLPEKESPDMLWSPEEIEENKFKRKYPRPVVTLEQRSEDDAYDRIDQNVSSVEPNEKTQLLPSGQDMEERSMPGVIINEVQTAADGPIPLKEKPVEDYSKAPDNSPNIDEALPRDSTENEPDDDDEEKPLLTETSPAQADSILPSLNSMDHMGFLASQLGSEDNGSTLMDKSSVNVDEDATSMDKDCAFDADCGVSEQESPGVPNGVSDFFSGNLDPFAADSENRASEIFSRLNSPSSRRSVDSNGKDAVPKECKYVSKTRYEMGLRPNSAYKIAGFESGNAPVSSIPSRSRNIPSYIPTSGVYTRTEEQTSTRYSHTSSSGMVEFSKLDPFAASASETMVTKFASGLPQQGMSYYRQPVDNPSFRELSYNAEQDDGMFSSFSERDPMSELSVNSDSARPPSIVAQNSKNFTRNTQSFSPNLNHSDGKYVSAYSLGSASYTNNKTNSFYPGRSSPTFTVPNITQGGQTSKKRPNHSGYVSMNSNVPRPTISRESANQKPHSSGAVMLDTSFSERDPFSETVGKVNEKTSGNSRSPGSSRNLEPRGLASPGVDPAGVRPTGITGATFENLFSKSRQTRSTGFTPPVLKPQGFGPSAIESTSLAPSSSPVARKPAVNQQTSPHVFVTPSFEKPSLGNLALKLSRQSAGKHNPTTQQLTSKPTSSSPGQLQNKNKNTEYGGKNIPSSSSKKSGYVAVSNAENAKTSRKYATEIQGSNPRKPDDFPSLSDQDIFSSILQGSASCASMDPFVNKTSSAGAVTVYTQAERDLDPYQKMSTRENDSGRKKNYVQASGKEKPAQSRANVVMANTSSTENVGKGDTRQLSSVPRKQISSDYESLPHSASTSQPPSSVSVKPTVNASPPDEKPREEAPELSQNASFLETADISQLSQTNFEDLLSGKTLQTGQVKESQGIELNEMPKQDIQENPENARTNESRTELKSDNTVDDVHSIDNVKPEGLAVGFSFDNRDPFAEISSQPDVAKNDPESERVEPRQNFVVVEQLLNSTNKEIVVSSYSNKPASDASGPQEASNPTPPPQPPSDNSSDGPPGGGNKDSNPPPLGRKPTANRKVSDIGVEYAKVLIQPKESGAVGGGESEPEPTEVDVSIEPVPEGTDERTSIDPFNKTEAEESIQNLEPYRPQSRGKSGNSVAVKFEESMKSHQIAFECLTLDRILGKGAFGVVRKAKLSRPGQGHVKTRPPMDVAVKCCIDNASEIYKNSFKLEAINLMKLDNKFIVRFLGISYDDKQSLLLVTELVPQGSLDKYLKDQKNLKILGNEVLLQFAIQISMGMEYLESKKLVHRDLAARNILVATESHVKISDFGLSRIYDDEYYRSHRENQRLPIRWLAPECLEQKKFTHHSDVWSLGVTLWEMFSYGGRPYENWKIEYTADLIKELKSGKRLEKPTACLDDVYTHILDCWKWKPSSRISFFLLKMMLEGILKEKYSKRPYFM